MNEIKHEQPQLQIPSLAQLLAAYGVAAAREQLKTDGKPSQRTVSATKQNFAKLMTCGEFKWDDPYTVMTADELEACYIKLRADGKCAVSAWKYISSAQSITAKWAIAHYRRMGYSVKSMELPVIQFRKAKRYIAPSEQTKRKVLAWYADKWSGKDKRAWLAVTMILQFAVRNGDVCRLTWRNFVEQNNGIYLIYVPHKTERSSGRRIVWPVHEALWERILEARYDMGKRAWVDDAPLILHAKQVLVRMNKDLRKAIPDFRNTVKGIYELRKLRIHTEYARNGVERASALSGDDIKTLCYYYADVSNIAQTAEMIETMI